MDETDLIVLYLALAIIPVILGMTVGRAIELLHYRSIRRREKKLADVLIFSGKSLPETARSSELVTGTVAISEDAFKAILSSIRNLLGGNIESYETLLDRARREAILRMKRSAKKRGANMIFNIKFQTSNISSSSGSSGLTSVEVMAWGTAVAVKRGAKSV